MAHRARHIQLELYRIKGLFPIWDDAVKVLAIIKELLEKALLGQIIGEYNGCISKGADSKGFELVLAILFG